MSRHQNLWGFQPSKVEFTHVSWRLHNKCLVNEIESTIMQQEWGIEPKKMHSSNKQGFAQHADLSIDTAHTWAVPFCNFQSKKLDHDPNWLSFCW